MAPYTSAVAQGRNAMPVQSTKLVIILDDEIAIASTLAMILRSQGIDTASFSEPLKALEAARSHAPSLVVSDLCMPSMSGIDFATQVQNDFPDCKILFFSGQIDGDLRAGVQIDGHSFPLMNKPIYPGELLRRVEALIGIRKPLPDGFHLSGYPHPAPVSRRATLGFGGIHRA
jgi:DNA-binding NtrC family response regulator